MPSPKTLEQETDLVCEKCGSPMVVKWGRNGHFLACKNYPECKNTKPYALDEEGKVVVEELPETDEVCEKCGSPMVVKNGRKGQFLACSGYPKCKNTRPIAEITDGKAVATAAQPEVKEVCEKCGAPMVVRTGRRGSFLACSAYPRCRNTKPLPAGQAEPVGQTGPPDRAGSSGAAAKPAKPKPIETEEKCDNCGKPMLLREGRYGPFLGCSGYPKCKTIRKASPEILEKYKKAETPRRD
jgi:DNA topoisomerase-1